MDDETQYYKDDFTYNNRRDVSGIFKTIKTQYKQLKLRTYEIFLIKLNMIFMLIEVGGKFQ